MANFLRRRYRGGSTLHIRLLAGVLAVCVLLMALDGWRTWQARDDTVARSEAETENLVRALAQQAHDLVQSIDAAVVEVRDRAERDLVERGGAERGGAERGGAERGGTGAQATLAGFVERRVQNLPLLGGLSVLDARSRRVIASDASSPLGAAFDDREYFRHHAGSADRGMHVGPPIQRRVDGLWVFTVSRRIDGPDGAFAGLVVANIPVREEQKVYGAYSVGRGGMIALLSTEGMVVLRLSGGVAASGMDISASPIVRAFRAGSGVGSVRYRSDTDGVERLGSFARVDGAPLFVVVSRAIDEVLAQWRSDGWMHFLVALGSAAALAVLGAVAAREIRGGERSDCRYRMLADNTSDAIVCLSAEGLLTYASPAFRRLTGRSAEEVASTPWGSLVHPDDRGAMLEVVPRLLAGEPVVTSACRWLCRDGASVWLECCLVLVDDEDGLGARFVGSLRDITARRAVEEELAALNRDIAAQAVTDPLTGLANRRRFDSALDREWRRAMREDTLLSLLMIDVDRFKLYNDRYGHQAGDRCLQAVSAAIAEACRRPADLVARYGGEELTVLLPVTDAAGAAEMAERVRAAIEACGVSHEANQPAGVVTASIGHATLAPQSEHSATCPSSLVAAADAALYEAKRRGRNRSVARADVASSPTPTPIADETARLASVALAGEAADLALGRSGALDRLASLAAVLFDVPACLVSLVGQERQCFIGRTGLDVTETGRDVSFCAHTIAGQGVFTVADATRDERFAANALVTGVPGIRFYAGAPLFGAGGHSVGALCLIDFAPRQPLNAAQKALLTALAAVASGCLDRGGAIEMAGDEGVLAFV